MKLRHLLGLVFLVVAPYVASACSCVPPGPPLESLEQSTAVFAGKVTEVEGEVSDTGFFGGELTATFEVTRYWKGVSSSTVQVTTASTGAACGYYFQEGESYLVYAHGVTDDLSVNSCSRTRLMENATEDLQELGPGTSTLPPFIAWLLRTILSLLCLLGFDVCGWIPWI